MYNSCIWMQSAGGNDCWRVSVFASDVLQQDPLETAWISWWAWLPNCLWRDWPGASWTKVRRQDEGFMSQSELGVEIEPAQCWELSVQTLLHISAEWCNNGSAADSVKQLSVWSFILSDVLVSEPMASSKELAYGSHFLLLVIVLIIMGSLYQKQCERHKRIKDGMVFPTTHLSIDYFKSFHINHSTNIHWVVLWALQHDGCWICWWVINSSLYPQGTCKTL